MINQKIRPVTLRGGEQAENNYRVWQPIEVLNSKSSLKTQLRSLVAYTIDENLNVIRLQFFPTQKWGNE